MWRVIVRVSYFHDNQSRLRNQVAALFVAMGLQNTNAGTWGVGSRPPRSDRRSVSQILQTLAITPARKRITHKPEMPVKGLSLSAASEA